MERRAKNITIEVWTNLNYARFIAIWRPEEEEWYTPPEDDDRPDQQKNVPYLLIVSSTYEPRSEVIGMDAIAPSQHPMPPEFLRQQIRHISYMFANEMGISKPQTKIRSEALLSKERLGFSKRKEYKIQVAPAQGSMSLKEFRDMLAHYSEEELHKIKVMTVGENPLDAHEKGLEEYIHTPQGSTTEQYITVTKLANVYDVDDPYLEFGTKLPEDPLIKHTEGMLDHPLVQDDIAQTEDAIADSEAELELLKTVDEIERDAMVSDTAATTVGETMTRDQTQQEAIKKLQARLKQLEEVQVQNPATI